MADHLKGSQFRISKLKNKSRLHFQQFFFQNLPKAFVIDHSSVAVLTKGISGHHCVTNLCFTCNRFRGTTTGARHPQFTRTSRCQLSKSVKITGCQDVMISQDRRICHDMLNSHDFQPRICEKKGPWVIFRWLKSWELFKHLSISSRVTSHPACVEQKPESLLPTKGNLEASRVTRSKLLYYPDSIRPLVPVTMGNPCCSKNKIRWSSVKYD